MRETTIGPPPRLFQVLRLETLGRIKLDALEVRQYLDASPESMASADTLVAAVNHELEWRIAWSKAVQAELGES